MLGDCFKQLEETLLSRVSEEVKERCEPLVQDTSKRWEELQKRVQDLIEAESNSLKQHLDERIEEQQKTLLARHAEIEEAVRTVLMCRGEVQELVGQQKTSFERTAPAAEAQPPSLSTCEEDKDLAFSTFGASTAGTNAAPEAESRAGEAAPRAAPAAEEASARSETPPLALGSPSPTGASVEPAELQPPVTPRSPKANLALRQRAASGDKDDPTAAPLPPSPGAAPEQLCQESPSDVRQPTRPLPMVPPISASFGGPVPPRKGWSRVLWGLVFALTVLVLVVVAAFCAYPIITVGLLSMLLLWVLYLCGEEPLIQLVTAKAYAGGRCSKKLVMLAGALRAVQGLRSSDENEQKIKALLWALFTCFALFNPEVGVLWALLETYPPLSVVGIISAVLVTTFCMALLAQRQMYERALQRGAGGFGAGTPRGSQAVQEIMREISAILQERRSRSRSTSERRLHELLAHCDADTLNELLERMAQPGDCSLERVLRYLRDTTDRTARSDLLELLCVHRVDRLTVRAKLTLLHTLMVVRLSSCSRNAEAFVENLLLSAEGDDLSELKCLQDASGQIHSMHKLVWQDVTDTVIRDRMLNHFLAEGTAQVAHRVLLGSDHFRALVTKGLEKGCLPEHLSFLQEDVAGGGGRQGPSYAGQCGHSWLKIMTDMDDTLYCSGARWPAGIDGRYAKHTRYPGVTAFYRELQGGPGVGQLCALSARPHIVGELVEKPIFNRFEKMIKDNALHAMPTVLTGSMDSGARFMVNGGDATGMHALFEKKFENFEEYMALYPEFKVVFIGDNGQADYAVGLKMWQKYPHNVEQVWIHQVQPRDKTWGYQPDSEAPVAFFDDYVMAAADAATRTSPLITPEGLLRIVLQAVEDFNKITTWTSDSHRESEVERLNQSIVRACAVLRALDIDDSEVELIDADRHPKPVSPSLLQTPPNTPGSSAGKLSLFSLARGLAKGAIAVGKSAAASQAVSAAEADEASTAIELGVQTDPCELLPPASPRPAFVTLDATLAGGSEAAEKSRSKSIFGMARNFVSGSSSSSGAATLMSPQQKSTELANASLPEQGSPTVPPLPSVELPPALEATPTEMPAGAAGSTSPSADAPEGCAATTSPPVASSSGGSGGGGISLLGLALDLKSKLSSAAGGGKAGGEASAEGSAAGSAAGSDGQVQAPEEVPASAGTAAAGEEASKAAEPSPPASRPPSAERTGPARHIFDLAGRAAAAFSQSPAARASEEVTDVAEVVRLLEEERQYLMQAMAGRDQELEELRGRLALLEGGGGGTGGLAGGDARAGSGEAGAEAGSGETPLERSALQAASTVSNSSSAELISPLVVAGQRLAAAGSDSIGTAGGSWMSFAESFDSSEPSGTEARQAAPDEGEVVEQAAPVSEAVPAPATGGSTAAAAAGGDAAGSMGSGGRMSIFSITRGLRSRNSSPATQARASTLPPVQELGAAASSSAAVAAPAEAAAAAPEAEEASEALAAGAAEGSDQHPAPRVRTSALGPPTLPAVLESPSAASNGASPEQAACQAEEQDALRRARHNSGSTDVDTVVATGDEPLPPLSLGESEAEQADGQLLPGLPNKISRAEASFMSVLDAAPESQDSCSPDKEHQENPEA